MFNETASSTEDRPVIRSTVRETSGISETQTQLREMVSTVFTIDTEIFEPEKELLGRDQVMLLNPDNSLVATFEGTLLLDSEQAYAQLDALMKATTYVPVFRLHEGKQVIHVVSGRLIPRPRAVWVNALLFFITVISVLILGTEMALSEIASQNRELALQLLNNFPLELWRGIPYAASILLILGAHELGHYFAARHHKLDVTLPYFIPAPFISFLGTFGAFIQLREPIRNRKVLMDVGAAGPLVGLVFAIPILFIGLATAKVAPISPQGLLEGNSLFYALAKTIVFGEFLPNGQVDVYLNQLAQAGWAGLLVTALNLIPLGQLDGGHILYALIGRRARNLYYPLLGISVLLAFMNSVWVLWVVLLLLFGRTYAAPLDMITPLDNRRRWIGILALVIFVVIFVPEPIKEITNSSTPIPRNSAYMIPMFTAMGIVLMQRLRR